MKKIFQFKCTECEEVFDEYTKYKQETTCPYCQSKADKIISAPRVKLEGITGAFPGAAMKWERMHRLPKNQSED